MHDPNPIHQNEDGLWYFWDEVWANEYGPFNSLQECKDVLKRYCIEELGIPESDFREG